MSYENEKNDKKNGKDQQSKETKGNAAKEEAKNGDKYHFRKEGDEEDLKKIYGAIESDVIKKGNKGDKKLKNNLLDRMITGHHGRK